MPSLSGHGSMRDLMECGWAAIGRAPRFTKFHERLEDALTMPMCHHARPYASLHSAQDLKGIRCVVLTSLSNIAVYANPTIASPVHPVH